MESVERESDGPWKLPEGWTWAALGQIVDIHDHRRRPIKSEDRQKRIANRQPNELFPYYGATGKVGVIDGYLFDFPSILLGEDGAPFLDRQRNKAYFVEGKYWVNNHAHIITPQASTISGWLLHSLNFIDYGPHVGGSTRLKLTKADLESIPIPLAPLAEQKRIVARVDALFAEIAEGEVALDDAREGLDIFRRALLKAAVTGELTKDWRAKNHVTETGHDLLARIRAERARQAQTNRRGRRAADAAPLDTSALPTLPEGWAWGTLGEIVLDSLIGLDRGSANQRREHRGAPYIKMQNVSAEGRVNLSNLVFVDAGHDEVQRFGIRDGDVLFNTRNSKELVGKTGLVENPERGTIFNNNLMRIRSLDRQTNAWIATAMVSPPFLMKLEGVKKATTSVAAIYAADLFPLPIPIPPPAEAAEILRRVSEALAAQADTLVLLDAEAGDAARLKQAILKAAFEGRLVPQDAADEPASVMLARLKATAPPATEATTKPKRGRRQSIA